MLTFQSLELSLFDKIKHISAFDRSGICDRTCAGIFMWRDFFKTEVAFNGESAIFRANYFGNENSYTFPIGKPEDTDATLNDIPSLPDAENEISFCALTESMLDTLKSRFTLLSDVQNPAWSDYIYNKDDLCTLVGKKYAGQRNHINKFKQLYPDFVFERISNNNLEQAKSFFIDVENRFDLSDKEIIEEEQKVLEVLCNYELYSLCGAILKANGKVIGISLGEILGDTLFVHTEKALKDVPGAYQMLVNCFAREFCNDSVRFINREEDDGIEGLRTSKLSYHPCRLIEKHFATFRI